MIVLPYCYYENMQKYYEYVLKYKNNLIPLHIEWVNDPIRFILSDIKYLKALSNHVLYFIS